jgi:hypothetical protein
MTANDRLSRRNALRTIGSLGTTAIAVPTATSARPDTRSAEAADRYIGVVDRIVDGRHVVVLLERDNQVVDQLVLDIETFDEVQERDVLVVVLRDGELDTYRHLPEKPERTGRSR